MVDKAARSARYRQILGLFLGSLVEKLSSFFHGKYTVKGQNGVEKLEFWFFESLAQVWKWFNLPSIISTVTWGDLS